MGRLFWKFFLLLWLAQVVTAFGVGIAIWLLHQERDDEPFAHMPPPSRVEGPGPTALPRMDSSGAEQRTDPPPGPPPHRHTPSPPLLPLGAGSLVSLLFATLLA